MHLWLSAQKPCGLSVGGSTCHHAQQSSRQGHVAACTAQRTQRHSALSQHCTAHSAAAGEQHSKSACACVGRAHLQNMLVASSIYCHAGVLKQMSLLDRFLPVWIIGAMGLGILLGYYVPAVEHAFSGIQIDSVSLPIAIGCAPRSTCPFNCGN